MTSQKLITLEEYEKMPPKAQGFINYMQADLPGSQLKGLHNPYPDGTTEANLWDEGQMMACLNVQDGEE